jgi:FkbM family methyltransferase
MGAAHFIYSVLLKPRLLRVAANSLLRASLPTKVVRHGATVVLNPEDPVVSGSLALGIYERAETDFFLSTCRPGMTFLDIGANCGYYTALFLNRAGPESRIAAIEPDPQCFEYLQRTVAANKGRNVSCLPLAASDTYGKTRLYRNLDNRGDNRLYANELAATSCEVETDTIDSILQRLAVDELNLIKMDVQGYEGRVLNGMQNTFRRASGLTLLTEFWPYGLWQAGTDPFCFLTSLADFGFSLFLLGDSGTLQPLVGYARLIESLPGRKYANLVATKGRNARSESNPGGPYRKAFCPQ